MTVPLGTSFLTGKCRACGAALADRTEADGFFCSVNCGYLFGATLASALDAARSLLLPPSPFRPRPSLLSDRWGGALPPRASNDSEPS